jgi:hypothetical protein
MSKQKAVWLVAGGPMQAQLAKAVKELDYKLILTDMDPACSAANYADVFIQKDTFDIEGNLKEADNLKRLMDVKACLTVAADCHTTVAHLSQLLGLSGVSPGLSNICRNKALTRQCLTEAGIPQPRSFRVGRLDDAKQSLQTLGGCGVIKATDNSASRGFAYLHSVDALTKEVFQTAQAAGTTGHVLIEEALIPRKDCIAELSVETLWYNGKMYWLNWVDRLFRTDLRFLPGIQLYDYDGINWGVEIGHINPAVHSTSLKLATQKMIENAGRCIGMHEHRGGHILKADIMLTDHGPVIIELTPRLSGGWDSSGTTPCRGADFQGGVLSLALGVPLDLDLWIKNFEIKNPSLYASVLTDIVPGAQNCIGRKFALGSGFERTSSLQNALSNLKESLYVV